MAEFVDVMKKYKEVCNYYEACSFGCPLNEIRHKYDVISMWLSARKERQN